MSDFVCKHCGLGNGIYEEGTVDCTRHLRVTRGEDGRLKAEARDEDIGVDFEWLSCCCSKCGAEEATLEALVVAAEVGVDPEQCSCRHHKRKHYTGGGHNWTCSECDCVDYAPAFAEVAT